MQKYSLKQKVALITGSARRIGAEIARTLHDVGMNVILHYNAHEHEADQLCAVLNAKRENSAAALRADLQSTDGKAFIAAAHAVWGSLYALINNASRYYRTEIDKVSDYAWEDLMQSNLKAPFFLSIAAAPFLAKQNGAIVNITDVSVDFPLKNYAVYCISKGGMVTMTKVLAKELGPAVRVNAVAPGAILWPEGENAVSDEDKNKIIKRVALKRAGAPEDIAKAVLFLIRDGQYITGQEITVDGGRF